jgi:hypothetical protein
MNDQEIVAGELKQAAEKRASLFEDMARQIRLNDGAKFGGAFLVVPPADGEPFQSLMLGQEEAAIFWSTIQTLAKIALEAAEKLNRQAGFR